jgi:hypothetical protein
MLDWVSFSLRSRKHSAVPRASPASHVPHEPDHVRNVNVHINMSRTISIGRDFTHPALQSLYTVHTKTYNTDHVIHKFWSVRRRDMETNTTRIPWSDPPQKKPQSPPESPTPEPLTRQHNIPGTDHNIPGTDLRKHNILVTDLRKDPNHQKRHEVTVEHAPRHKARLPPRGKADHDPPITHPGHTMVESLDCKG